MLLSNISGLKFCPTCNTICGCPQFRGTDLQSDSNENPSAFRSCALRVTAKITTVLKSSDPKDACTQCCWATNSPVPGLRTQPCIKRKIILSKKWTVRTATIIRFFCTKFARTSPSVRDMVWFWFTEILVSNAKYASTREQHQKKAIFPPIAWILLISRLSWKDKCIQEHSWVTKIREDREDYSWRMSGKTFSPQRED